MVACQLADALGRGLRLHIPHHGRLIDRYWLSLRDRGDWKRRRIHGRSDCCCDALVSAPSVVVIVVVISVTLALVVCLPVVVAALAEVVDATLRLCASSK